MQQILDAKLEAQRPALLRLAFRPFFLLGSAFAVVAVLRWVALLQSWQIWEGQMPALFWHAHEMIFGFVVAIVLGFLLTAVQTWTGVPGLRGKALGFLVLCWLCARGVFWLSPEISWIVYWLPDFVLIVSAGFFLGRPILARRQWRNLPFVPVLLLFALLHTGFSYSLEQQNYGLAREFLIAAFWLVILLISVMGARVIPFFTARRWQSEQVQEPSWLSVMVPLTFLIVITPASILNQELLMNLKPIAFAVIGFALSWRVYHWHHRNNWQEPLLWSLHISYAAIAIGCLIMGFSKTGSAINTHAVHLVALAGIGGIILAMISRVSLGHTGQPLKLASAMPGAFAILFAAALLRFLGPVLNVNASNLFYLIAGALFALAFVAYLVYYSPLLSRPRADGRPG